MKHNCYSNNKLQFLVSIPWYSEDEYGNCIPRDDTSAYIDEISHLISRGVDKMGWTNYVTYLGEIRNGETIENIFD